MNKELEKILNNENLTKEQKVRKINEYYEDYRKQIDKDLNNYLMRQRLGAAIQIGTAGIPMTGIGNVGGTVGLNLLKRQLGRKVSENIGSGTLSGAVSGGIFGIGKGLTDNKRP